MLLLLPQPEVVLLLLRAGMNEVWQPTKKSSAWVTSLAEWQSPPSQRGASHGPATHVAGQGNGGPEVAKDAGAAVAGDLPDAEETKDVVNAVAMEVPAARRNGVVA